MARSGAAARDDATARDTGATWRADEAVAYLRRALEEGAPGDDRGALLAALGTAAFDAGLPEACGWLSAAADEAERSREGGRNDESILLQKHLPTDFAG